MVIKKEINFAEDYSYNNALKSAQLILDQKGLLDKNPKSIINALLDMVTQGLNPIKNQCYFIGYGNDVTLSRSYFGLQAAAKRACPEIISIYANEIYEKDEFDYEIRGSGKRFDELLRRVYVKENTTEEK